MRIIDKEQEEPTIDYYVKEGDVRGISGMDETEQEEGNIGDMQMEQEEKDTRDLEADWERYLDRIVGANE